MVTAVFWLVVIVLIVFAVRDWQGNRRIEEQIRTLVAEIEQYLKTRKEP